MHKFRSHTLHDVWCSFLFPPNQPTALLVLIHALDNSKIVEVMSVAERRRGNDSISSNNSDENEDTDDSDDSATEGAQIAQVWGLVKQWPLSTLALERHPTLGLGIVLESVNNSCSPGSDTSASETSGADTDTEADVQKRQLAVEKRQTRRAQVGYKQADFIIRTPWAI